MKSYIAMLACLASFACVADTEVVGGVTWSFSVNAGEATVSAASPLSGDVALPQSLGNCRVTAIRSYAFAESKNLTGLNLGSDLKSIGAYSLASCTSLTNVTISAALSSIGESAFSGCTKLSSIVIPSNVVSVGDYAFSGCTKLACVEISEGTSCIGNWMFEDCTALKSVCVPASVTSIGKWAFKKCSGITNMTFSAGLLSIGEYAFEQCTGLKKLTFPSSVTSCGAGAFYSCSSLMAYDFEGAPPSLISNTDIKKDATIRYNVAYESEWQPIVSTCGWTNASPYDPSREGLCRVTITAPYGDITGAGDYQYGSLVVLDAPAEPFPFQIGENDPGWHVCRGTSTSLTLTNHIEFVVYGDTNICWDVWQTNWNVWCNSPFDSTEYADVTVKITPPADSIEGESGIEPVNGWYAPQGSVVDVSLILKPGWIVESWEGLPASVAHDTNVSVVVTNHLNFTSRFEEGAYVPASMTGGKQIAIGESSWVYNYLNETYGDLTAWRFQQLYGDDFAQALQTPNGKSHPNGQPMLVWEDYVAGTDPTNPESKFAAKIDFEDGAPVVRWKPDLNEDGTKSLRKYTTSGCQSLGGDWVDMSTVPEAEKPLYRFFKVSVDMP